MSGLPLLGKLSFAPRDHYFENVSPRTIAQNSLDEITSAELSKSCRFSLWWPRCSLILGSWSCLLDPGFLVLGPGSLVLGPSSLVLGPWSWVVGLYLVLGPWWLVLNRLSLICQLRLPLLTKHISLDDFPQTQRMLRTLKFSWWLWGRSILWKIMELAMSWLLFA